MMESQPPEAGPSDSPAPGPEVSNAPEDALGPAETVEETSAPESTTVYDMPPVNHAQSLPPLPAVREEELSADDVVSSKDVSKDQDDPAPQGMLAPIIEDPSIPIHNQQSHPSVPKPLVTMTVPGMATKDSL